VWVEIRRRGYAEAYGISAGCSPDEMRKPLTCRFVIAEGASVQKAGPRGYWVASMSSEDLDASQRTQVESQHRVLSVPTARIRSWRDWRNGATPGAVTTIAAATREPAL
jgi:hypothetical protein